MYLEDKTLPEKVLPEKAQPDLLIRGFIEWVGKQPRGKEYTFFDLQYCALAQWWTSTGLSTSWDESPYGAASRYIPMNVRRQTWFRPRTFGALYDRLIKANLPV